MAIDEQSASASKSAVRPIIRAAAPGDVAGIRSCVGAAFERYVERIGKPPGPMLLDFPALIGEGRVWVADAEGEVVGILVVYETGQGFYLDTVAVRPVRHGTGIGRELLQFAEHEALRRGFDSIYLCTNAKMTENQVLYPKIGYVEYDRKFEAGDDRIFYRKPLGRGTPPAAG